MSKRKWLRQRIVKWKARREVWEEGVEIREREKVK